jgi:hypothetical protein
MNRYRAAGSLLSTSSPADRRKNPARKKGNPSGKAVVREYRVVPNGTRWDIERDGAFKGSFAHDVHTAIGIATAEAQRDVRGGLDAVVCMEEKDGTCRHIWP